MNARLVTQVAFVTTLSLLGVSCTDTGLEPIPAPPPPELDNLVRIKGEFCSEPSADIIFPVKVLYIVDQSASLQCTDSMNRRFTALNNSVNNFLGSQPNGEVGFIGFSSWAREAPFSRDQGAIANFIDPAAGLGPATDYQGALATAIRIIEQDILAVGGPERARTRYIVNFVSDGVPEPRCNAGCEDTISDCSDGDDNDGDGRTDTTDPDCANITDNSLHPDNLYGVCNTTEEVPDDVYVDYTGICPEYNQPNQILQRVQQLLDLKDIYSVGDVQLNTVLLFSPQAVVEARCPGASMAFGYDKVQATATLQSMADRGNGTFRDINLTGTQDDFLNFEVTSITAEQTLTSLLAYNEHARVTSNGLMPDTDTDGIDDETEVQNQLERFDGDTDADLFGDLFETHWRTEGFDPGNNLAPALSCSDARDGDGDGLNDCEEDFMKTDPLQPDTDGDGILDWIELLKGTDPLADDSLGDLDFDGVLNGDEIRGGTNPLEPDSDVYLDSAITYDLNDLGVSDVDGEERHCYDFDVQRIPMVITPIPSNQGLNRILLYTSERPSRVAGVPGEIRVACFESFWNGGSIKDPASGVIDVSTENLDTIRATVDQTNLDLAACGFFPDGTVVNRALTEQLINTCMPRKIELNRRLYRREDLVDLLRQNFDGNNYPTIPERAYTLFVPIQNFDADQHCFRLWETELLVDFLEAAYDACGPCVEDLAADDGAAP